MQLLIIIALILFCGKNEKILSEVKPILESFAGEEFGQVLQSAEEISSMFKDFNECDKNVNAQKNECEHKNNDNIDFPLAPIADIADREITYSLSKYISSNQVC